MELLSRIKGKNLMIERVEFANISDGQTHTIEWQCDPNGQIEVLLDEQPRVRLRDSSFRYPFKQLSIRNQGGDFAIVSVSLLGN